MLSARSHQSGVSSNWGISSINDDSRFDNSDAGGSQANYKSGSLDHIYGGNQDPLYDEDPLFKDRFYPEAK